MVKVTKRINKTLFIVNIESYLKEQAEELLNIVSRVEQSKLVDKANIQIGFTMFTLHSTEEGIVIMAADYSKNPFVDHTEDLTIPLWIQLEQGMLLNKLGLTGEMVSFQDKILCSKGALGVDHIYLERSGDCDKNDSGWFIGAVGENDDSEEYEAFYAYQVLKMRPALMQALTLPTGYMAVFYKDELKAVIDDKEREIYKV